MRLHVSSHNNLQQEQGDCLLPKTRRLYSSFHLPAVPAVRRQSNGTIDTDWTLLQDEDEQVAAFARTARVMERIAYQNSELELLMDYKANAPPLSLPYPHAPFACGLP